MNDESKWPEDFQRAQDEAREWLRMLPIGAALGLGLFAWIVFWTWLGR
jgi:hypothetical protein